MKTVLFKQLSGFRWGVTIHVGDIKPAKTKLLLTVWDTAQPMKAHSLCTTWLCEIRHSPWKHTPLCTTYMYIDCMRYGTAHESTLPVYYLRVYWLCEIRHSTWKHTPCVLLDCVGYSTAHESTLPVYYLTVWDTAQPMKAHSLCTTYMYIDCMRYGTAHESTLPVYYLRVYWLCEIRHSTWKHTPCVLLTCILTVWDMAQPMKAHSLCTTYVYIDCMRYGTAHESTLSVYYLHVYWLCEIWHSPWKHTPCVLLTCILTVWDTAQPMKAHSLCTTYVYIDCVRYGTAHESTLPVYYLHVYWLYEIRHSPWKHTPCVLLTCILTVWDTAQPMKAHSLCTTYMYIDCVRYGTAHESTLPVYYLRVYWLYEIRHSSWKHTPCVLLTCILTVWDTAQPMKAHSLCTTYVYID